MATPLYSVHTVEVIADRVRDVTLSNNTEGHRICSAVDRASFSYFPLQTSTVHKLATTKKAANKAITFCFTLSL
jgi:hypothetical protein